MEEEVRVLKSFTCDSLSGRSKLNYQVGVVDGQPQVRITSNSGGGMFARDWVPLLEVFLVLKSHADKETVAATAFKKTFQGRSVNSLGFLLAILKHQGAVQAHPEKARAYQVADVDGFVTRIQALMPRGPQKTTGVSDKAVAVPRRPLSKSPGKKA